jgi:hypothetical protein
MQTRPLAVATAALVSLVTAPSFAQTAPGPTDWRWSYSAAAFDVFKSDLDHGGSAGMAGFFAGISGLKPIDSKLAISTAVRFDLLDFNFSNPTAFGGVAPWNRVYQPGISVGVSYLLDNGWRLGFVPTVQYSGESGAKFGDAIIWGALASASKTFGKDLTLGLGVAGFSRIEKTSFFPFVIVNWQITENLRLANPFAAGPAGPAGLELVYDLGGGWETGVGAAYRSFRFRNSEDAPTPNSIGEARMIPVFARIAKNLTPATQLELMAGATVGNQLKLYDQGGERLVAENQDAAPFVALTFSGRF